MSPRIYVACLASYNNGILHGAWIDAAQDADDLYEEIQDRILATSRQPVAEEWAIHDYEGFHDLILDEFESLERVSEIAQGIEERGGAYAAFVEETGDTDLDAFDEAYRGEYESREDYAQTFYADLGEIPDHLWNYIDWSAVARDLFMDAWDAPAPGGGIYVFWR